VMTDGTTAAGTIDNGAALSRACPGATCLLEENAACGGAAFLPGTSRRPIGVDDQCRS
jgi:hypothetical protein